jgi:asparagine synthase (glutamine-hydrolysing)
MCGIAGLIVSNGSSEEHLPRLRAMTDAVRHRGPDDTGVEVVHEEGAFVAFGHRRLAIIDLSAAGHQPMLDAATGNRITFNGEIYNYRELRRELEEQGHVFHTQTDTEVILKAYASWGADCFKQLRGIFGLGIWDESARTLLIARDQLGVKPVYYWQGGQSLIFASEVRALLASDLLPRRLDFNGLRSYLVYGSVQEPYTLVQGVQSLLPGHTLMWQDGKIKTERYWRLPAPEETLDTPPADYLEQIKALLKEAIRLQLVSDVPLGAFLSGGIDSTAITALMRAAASGPVKTFSVVFDEARYDERVYSQLAARYIGTEHTELLLCEDEVLRALPEALAAFDQPSMDGLNTYFVSKVTREAGLTVALSGLGGDELFGGYDGYYKALLAERWGGRFKITPGVLRNAGAEALHHLPWAKAGMVADLMQTSSQPYFWSRRVFNARQVAEMVEPEMLAASNGWEAASLSRLAAETADYDAVNRASALELQTFMLSTLLRDADQMSMAHALEVRVPLLDHRLVEYLFRLPGACKLDPVHPKPLLTRSLDGALPRECVYRPKRGFELPFDVWLRKGLQERIRSSFVDQSANHVAPFKAKGLARVWKRFDEGRLGWSRIWGLFVLRDWLARHKVSI